MSYELDVAWIETRDGQRTPISERTVYIDFAGMVLAQNVLDIVTQEANRDSSKLVNIFLRRMSVIGGMPRLICDTQTVYDVAAALLKDRERADRADSGMAEGEKGHPYSIDEAERCAANYPDEYVRELVQFLLNRIVRLSKNRKEL